jgi:hypothetical protein
VDANNATQEILRHPARHPRKQWTVEAETAEEAQELLLSGVRDRCGIGERIHAEIEQITE